MPVGPLDSLGNWETCWQLYSIDPDLLKRSLQRSARKCSSDEFVYYFFSKKFRFSSNLENVIPVVPNIFCGRPFVALAEADEHVLFHGLSLDWVPAAAPFSWHALDLHVNGPTRRGWANIFRHMQQSQCKIFTVYGLDCVPSDHLVEMLSFAPAGIYVHFVCNSLANVEANFLKKNLLKIVRVGPENVDVPKNPVAPTVLIDRISQSNIDLAVTYFVTPLMNPALVSPFLAAIPNLAAPKLVISGPSQSGKSTLARWMISRVKLPVIEVNTSNLFSKYLGSSEKRLAKIFRTASLTAPCVLLIEGVHAICPNRESAADDETGTEQTYSRLLATFLMGLDGLESRAGLAVIATSLLPPADLDPAAVRPGRLETWICLP